MEDTCIRVAASLDYQNTYCRIKNKSCVLRPVKTLFQS